jgi:hypothetical protein
VPGLVRRHLLPIHCLFLAVQSYEDGATLSHKLATVNEFDGGTITTLIEKFFSTANIWVESLFGVLLPWARIPEISPPAGYRWAVRADRKRLQVTVKSIARCQGE